MRMQTGKRLSALALSALLLLALCALLLLALCACGQVVPSNAGGVSAAPSEPPAPAPEASFALGTVNGGTYTNAFLGIGCTLDENWSYFDQDQLAQMGGLVADSMTDEELAEALKDASLVYDMYASAEEGMLSINICIENLGALYGFTLDESGYIDISMENLDETLASVGYENVVSEKTVTQFAGAERHCIAVNASIQEIPFYEKLICIKKGSYMAVITLASLQENVLGEMEALFYSVS